MSNKMRAGLLAGGLLGVVLVLITVVSSLSPALGVLGCCACLMPIGAGIFAVNKYVGQSPTPVQIGDGAILGGIAGAVGGLINLVIGAPLSYLINAAAIQAQMEQMKSAGINIPVTGFALAIVSGSIGVVVYALLSAMGGLIGVAMFEKRKDGAGTPPPPPPPNFGGTTMGGGAAGGYGGQAGSSYGGGQAGGGPTPPAGGGFGAGS